MEVVPTRRGSATPGTPGWDLLTTVLAVDLESCVTVAKIGVGGVDLHRLRLRISLCESSQSDTSGRGCRRDGRCSHNLLKRQRCSGDDLD